ARGSNTCGKYSMHAAATWDPTPVTLSYSRTVKVERGHVALHGVGGEPRVDYVPMLTIVSQRGLNRLRGNLVGTSSLLDVARHRPTQVADDRPHRNATPLHPPVV